MKRSRSNIKQELDQVLKAFEQFKQAVSIETIKEVSGLDIGLRTLQRRLDKLIEQGLVVKSGKTKSSLYSLNQGTTTSEFKPDKPNSIPLSTASKEILEILSAPATHRRPVGYNREFLLSYRPNVDSYLSDNEKQKLAELGKTARLDQPAGTYAKEILQRLLIDLSWNSSRLEGNTYSLLDTQQLLSQGRPAGTKTAMEAQMILNHKDAIEFIVRSADEIGFNRYTITSLHAMLSYILLPDPAASGRLRYYSVGITNSVFTPLGIPQQIEEMLEILLTKATEIEDPFEQSFFIMVQLPYLQPFDDVNKRVSRLAANIPLNKHNLAPLAFVDVPEDLYLKGTLGVYELNRIELLKDVYFWAYERSALRYAALRQSLGEPDPFRLKYRDEIRAIMAEIVSNAIPPDKAGKLISDKAKALSESDREKFIEIIDTELLSLHEGNYARYWVTPSEFKQWETVWGRK